MRLCHFIMVKYSFTFTHLYLDDLSLQGSRVVKTEAAS